ncbi:hypothetical protein G5714_002684 [Onychostoma macrolepis]|uniref:SET domain-containing protein n=1 Tax=Onychostoma macrolepis TaxID=369639 RepID=A0A7J6D852_9TELE|nr:hypothetical protein G5714_002684 [Onychostoma macrolepis]
MVINKDQNADSNLKEEITKILPLNNENSAEESLGSETNQEKMNKVEVGTDVTVVCDERSTVVQVSEQVEAVESSEGIGHTNDDANGLKGRGVVATHPVEAADFVLEYRGELLEAEECREDGTRGRLCSDNHKSPNCTMKKIIVDNRPHLCLFAVKRIEIGCEDEYNYGNDQWPWRKKEPEKQASASETFVSSCVMDSLEDDAITQVRE